MIVDKPVGGVNTEVRTHPSGKAGARLSLKEVAERAWKGRMSPRVRAWATKVLADAGVSRGGKREKAKAILEAYRKKVPYIPDPVMGEFMATPEQTLCLDENGLCIVGGDCDDAAITIAAALMSIGILTMIIGSSHREPNDLPTHVYMAFQDDMNEWVRMDGTTKLPVGKSVPYAREWWVEPGADARERAQGDFVGMSGADGTLSGAPSPIDLLYPYLR